MYISHITPLHMIGCEGNGKLQFNRPYGVFVDNSTDSMLVCDIGNNRIQVSGAI